MSGYFIKYKARISGKFSQEQILQMRDDGKITDGHLFSLDRENWFPADDLLLPPPSGSPNADGFDDSRNGVGRNKSRNNFAHFSSPSDKLVLEDISDETAANKLRNQNVRDDDDDYSPAINLRISDQEIPSQKVARDLRNVPTVNFERRQGNIFIRSLRKMKIVYIIGALLIIGVVAYFGHIAPGREFTAKIMVRVNADATPMWAADYELKINGKTVDTQTAKSEFMLFENVRVKQGDVISVRSGWKNAYGAVLSTYSKTVGGLPVVKSGTDYYSLTLSSD